MTASPYSLQLQQLGAARGQQLLFSDIDCTVQAGELLQVSGENGSGKTTLLRTLAGLNSDYSGELLWCGANIRRCWHDYAPHILYLGHQPALKMPLTAHENLTWYARCAGADAEQVDAALHQLGIGRKAHLPCQQLSAGQQRRVVLARLFFSTQSLWILDEPFTALDAHGFALVAGYLQQHLASGGIVVLTTHHGSEKIGVQQRVLTLGTPPVQAQENPP